MLYLVLLLVLAALGTLIAALTTQAMLWAWISVGLSVVAAGVLVLDWIRHRGTSGEGAPEGAGDVVEADRDAGPDAGEPTTSDAETLVTVPPSPENTSPENEPQENADERDSDEDADPDAEPGEEDTDAADAIVVSELDAEVVVVDERPRYHLTSCSWLGERETLPLSLTEARTLGFTPCARCRPDATLAARYRSAHRAHR